MSNIFSHIKSVMNYSSERQKILNENIANSSTPGYIANDLSKPNFGSTFQSHISQNSTHPMHLSSNSTNGNFKRIMDYSGEFTMTGNNINIEEQMLKTSENNMTYQMATNLYKKAIGMLKKAISNNG